MATKKPKTWTSKRIEKLANAIAYLGEDESALATYLKEVDHKLVELATNTPEFGVDRGAEYVFARLKYVQTKYWDLDAENEFAELRKNVTRGREDGEVVADFFNYPAWEQVICPMHDLALDGRACICGTGDGGAGK